MKKIMYWLSKLTCVVAMGMAVASVNSTCFFTAYQPDVPESLDLKATPHKKCQERQDVI